MSVFHPNSYILSRHKPLVPSCSASLESGFKRSARVNSDVLVIEESKERIRRLFRKVELSVSAYDTAWVAMVPSPHYSHAPCFSGCVDWILENQLKDGSWGLPQQSVRLLKDDLSSTLACVLALKRWDVGEEHINKGLRFLKSNFASVTDNNQSSPIGFDIIFPGMLEYANDLGLKLPVEQTLLNTVLNKKAQEIKRCSERNSPESEAYLAYLSEGMGNLQNWDMVIKYQRKNGSLFNSPSTTAAYLNHIQNTGCLNYLSHLLEKFGNAVPTVYPIDIYAHLCMVDTLERLGIDRHFKQEIRSVLDEAYSCWLQDDEEIFMDVDTCALAFRILRMNGYNVLSDKLTRIAKEECYLNSLGENLKDTNEALQLYRASEAIIYSNESALEKQNSWSNRFLEHKLSNGSVHLDRCARIIFQEVHDALKFPFHSNLERMVNRRNIEQYEADSIKILKTSYSSPNISNAEYVRLAVEDFNVCQSIQQKELKLLESWVIESSLDKLKFARQKTAYCYFSAAATLFSPELSDARMAWAKNGILTTVVDDFFDVGGSIEELLNLIQLVEKWDVNEETECCSEHVRIIFSALHHTICEIGESAFKRQAWHVTTHIIEIWLELLNSMLKEAEWTRDSYVPKLDEYMSNGFISFALGPIVLPTVYLIGPELSENVVQNGELRSLFKLMSTCGRLLNDIQSFKRESKEGKLNAVSLYMIHTDATTEEDAINEIKCAIEINRRELLQLVLQEKDSVVPRACKDLFWKMCRVVHQFYIKDDGFTSEDMFGAVKDILYKPITRV
ncbi:terpene synthase 6, chloroplastic [Daucus carota subsp. sativus]|uniref:terpene synthase 6, chloroplastic n=1 Tax=Daucus carota subsp. sativus TaxID=79200 RepID=UPI0007F0252D|nr:PREDICTED: ent-kaur-16-ene synthase, chloroplastic [Daucus carota subsp. sativus]